MTPVNPLDPPNDDELDPRDREALSQARAPLPPPPDLEEDTVAALRQRGLIRARRSGVAVAWLAIAATVVGGFAWFLARRAVAPAPETPRFVLLLYAGDQPIGGAAEARREEYTAWARDLASKGVTITGEELSNEASEITRGGSRTPGEPLPRGFFIIRADDLASAERIASSCPHLRYGGRIVIKRVVG